MHSPLSAPSVSALSSFHWQTQRYWGHLSPSVFPSLHQVWWKSQSDPHQHWRGRWVMGDMQKCSNNAKSPVYNEIYPSVVYYYTCMSTILCKTSALTLSPAVNHHGCLAVGVHLPHFLNKLDQWWGVEGHSMVRPGGVLEVGQLVGPVIGLHGVCSGTEEWKMVGYPVYLYKE